MYSVEVSVEEGKTPEMNNTKYAYWIFVKQVDFSDFLMNLLFWRVDTVWLSILCFTVGYISKKI